MNINNRIFGLDLMRATAISMVVFMHSASLLNPIVKIPRFGNILGKFLAMTQPFGLLGVEMFFVLSGFLIGNILINLLLTSKEFNSIVIYKFWVKRWYRTLPNYFLILVILIIIYYLTGKLTININIFLYFFFSQNLFYPHPDFFPEAWSLAIEEWFYLILPLYLFIINKYINKKISKIVILQLVFWTFLIIFTVIKILNAMHPLYDIGFDSGIRKITFFRLDSIMYGVIVALYYKINKDKILKIKSTLFIIGILGIIICTGINYLSSLPNFQLYNKLYFLTFFINAFLLSFLSLFFSISIPYLLNLPKPKSKFLYETVTKISLISYSIYLTHYALIFLPIFNNIKNETIISAFLIYFSYWFVVLILSFLIYTYYESYFLRIRNNI